MPTTAEGFASRTQQLKAELVAQGTRVQHMLEVAFAALFERKANLASQAIEMDDGVDKADVAIEQAAVALLIDATREGASLDAQHLRAVLTIVKSNNELERVADVAVDIAEMVPAVSHIALPFPDTFRVMANSVIGILRDTNTSLAKSDPHIANIVLQSQHAVWAFKAALLREAEQRVAKGTYPVEFAFHLHETAGMCEIIADHCTNIAEQVIYQTTGAIVRHAETCWVEVPRQ